MSDDHSDRPRRPVPVEPPESDDPNRLERTPGPATRPLGGSSEASEDHTAEDVREAIETATSALEATRSAIETVTELASGRPAEALGSGARGASSGLQAADAFLDDPEARRAMAEASRTARSGRQAYDQGRQAAGQARDLAGESEIFGSTNDDVEYHLEVEGLDAQWGVTGINYHEGLCELYEITIHALVHGSHPEVADLLNKNVSLALSRHQQQRSFKGFVKHAQVNEIVDGVEIHLSVGPQAFLLGMNLDSRIYQNKTAPEIIAELYQRLLGSRSRELDDRTTRTYPRHEYIVQYQESDLRFLTRLCEQEGFFYFFDHEERDHELLVLADSTTGLRRVRGDGRVPFSVEAGQMTDDEAVTHAQRVERIGPTDIVVRELDFTHPGSPREGTSSARASGDLPVEVYDHTDAVALYDYQGTAYTASDAQTQATMRADLSRIGRKSWVFQSTVLTAQPGWLIEVTGCPDGSMDGTYLITSASGSGEATAGRSGGIGNTLSCVPTALQYRPPRRTGRRLALGPETATVVGPSGEEIHTDEHGRIKVQFHWDRQGQNDERSSCWLRVAQMWAGPGWGTWFLPRIGMEVIVQFMGGNPDKPFVAGCLYNGDNHTPYPLPAEKTKSTLKSNSSMGGGGSNEFRYEDKAGSEEIYLHAQKDFNEVVENNHTTHVKANQTNTVDGNQTETVGGNQTMTVKKDRKKTIEQNEKSHILGNRTEEVEKDEQIHVHQNRKVKIDQNEKLSVLGNRVMIVQGKDTEDVTGGREVTVADHDNLQVIGGANRNVSVNGQYNIEVNDHYKLVQGGSEQIYLHDQNTYIESGGRVQMKNPAFHLDVTPSGKVLLTATSITLQAAGCEIKMEKGVISIVAATKVEIGGDSSGVRLEASGATVSGSKVTSSAQGMNEISGAIVKIN